MNPVWVRRQVPSGFSSNLMTPGGECSHSCSIHHISKSSRRWSRVECAPPDRRDDDGSLVVPIIVHSDAAFADQGVVMETFQMSQTRGYKTGGTIHVIINNQIGYTISNAEDARSTYYCTEVAKMIQAPVFHVNGDDPEAVLFVAQMAVDYRMTFKKDVVIDIVSYRRRGHNEGDEPAITQPQMYSVIRKHPTTLTLYAQKVIQEGVISEEEYLSRAEQYRDDLEAGKAVAWDYLKEPNTSMFVDWGPFLDPDKVDTAEGVARSNSELSGAGSGLPGVCPPPAVTKIEDRKRCLRCDGDQLGICGSHGLCDIVKRRLWRQADRTGCRSRYFFA